MKEKPFEAIVRKQPSPFGVYGRIVSKSLGKLIGKKVRVTLEVIS